MKRNTLLRRVFLLVSGLFFGLLTITIVILSVFFSNLLIGNAEDYLRLIMQQNQRIVNTALARACRMRWPAPCSARQKFSHVLHVLYFFIVDELRALTFENVCR